MRRAPSQPPELPGYTFVKLLGSGGFSDVYLYDQKLPRRRVAVKVLLTDDLTSANRAAFVAEANLMAQLSAHPYIVTIYQADVAGDDRPYFVMEYCSGPSLGERYKRERFDVADALRTGVRLSSAVATAHAAGILHRDIKPANVLSNDYGWPALTDFGISSAVDDSLPIHTSTLANALGDTATGSGTGASVGMSVPWSPPEMFEDEPQPDVRSDVFSLAATIYTILAGQSPFEVRGRSNGTLDLIGRIERGAITPMERTDVPSSLLAVLQKGMASDRNDRFATAVDFARALQRVELELGYAPTSIEVPNLLVAAPDRDQDGAEEDETRVRSVATIQAQPAAPAIVPPLEPDPALDATVVRGAQSVVAQPPSEVVAETVVRSRPAVVETPVVASDPLVANEPRKSKLVPILVSVGIAVLAAAIVTSIILFGAPSSPDTADPNPTASGEAIIPTKIPTPELVGTPALEGTTVNFTVANPDPVDGDGFVWRVSNRTASEALRPLEGDVVAVPDYVAGQTVCVEVSVLRSGKTSGEPLEACYPS